MSESASRSTSQGRPRRAKRCHRGAFGLLLLAVLGAAPGHADSLRCGRSLVTTGDTQADVQATCGAPEAKESGTLQRAGFERGKPVRVSRWRYRGGKGRYDGIVVFYRGTVVAIERGTRR